MACMYAAEYLLSEQPLLYIRLGGKAPGLPLKYAFMVLS